MTILTIMRHAKSRWDEPGLEDFDRPLNDRGRSAARRVGCELKQRRMRFDQVIASPAQRVRETLRELAHGYGDLPHVRFDDRLYGAGTATLEHIVRAIPDHLHAPLLIGHNPGLHELLLRLTALGELRQKIAGKYPTAAVAVVTLPAAQWGGIEPGTGELRELILPRELD
jgi:phosphohistidine phosphatase